MQSLKSPSNRTISNWLVKSTGAWHRFVTRRSVGSFTGYAVSYQHAHFMVSSKFDWCYILTRLDAHVRIIAYSQWLNMAMRKWFRQHKDSIRTGNKVCVSFEVMLFLWNENTSDRIFRMICGVLSTGSSSDNLPLLVHFSSWHALLKQMWCQKSCLSKNSVWCSESTIRETMMQFIGYDYACMDTHRSWVIVTWLLTPHDTSRVQCAWSLFVTKPVQFVLVLDCWATVKQAI